MGRNDDRLYKRRNPNRRQHNRCGHAAHDKPLQNLPTAALLLILLIVRIAVHAPTPFEPIIPALVVYCMCRHMAVAKLPHWDEFHKNTRAYPLPTGVFFSSPA